ncbi:MAG: hypothetical protein M5U28_18000 [Sandaracinaceae bacterium]|nr:hypothetical protein [Sandaracinaceae bacterium]
MITSNPSKRTGERCARWPRVIASGYMSKPRRTSSAYFSRTKNVSDAPARAR